MVAELLCGGAGPAARERFAQRLRSHFSKVGCTGEAWHLLEYLGTLASSYCPRHVAAYFTGELTDDLVSRAWDTALQVVTRRSNEGRRAKAVTKAKAEGMAKAGRQDGGDEKMLEKFELFTVKLLKQLCRRGLEHDGGHSEAWLVQHFDAGFFAKVAEAEGLSAAEPKTLKASL